MMTSKTLKQALTVSIITVLALTFMSFSPLAFAQATTAAPAVSGSGIAVTNPEDNIIGGETDARAFITKILRFALTFLGILCVVLIIYGGFLYITSAGEEDGAKKGKTIIIYCIIGLVIIYASYAIVNTVLGGISQPA